MSGAAARTYSRWATTFAIGFAGAWVATRIGAPLPWLLGAMAATGVAAARGVRFFGGPPSFPPTLRLVFIPVIGVLIGGAFRPETLAELGAWWPGLVSMLLFVPAAHALNHLLLRRVSGFEAPTAFFGGMPGGLIEAIEMGGEKGADVRAISLLQFARVAVVVSLVPLVFSAAQGQAVGSAAGVAFQSSALTVADAILLVAAGGVGFVLGRKLKLPAGQITGPMLLSAVVHGAGWTEAAPPPELVQFAQLVIGITLGCRFAGAEPVLLRRCFGASILTVCGMLALGALFAGALSLLGLAPFGVMVLCYAPGGLVEMGLIALSLNASPIFVTAHHIVRIVITVTIGSAGWRLFGFDRSLPACQERPPGE